MKVTMKSFVLLLSLSCLVFISVTSVRGGKGGGNGGGDSEPGSRDRDRNRDRDWDPKGLGGKLNKPPRPSRSRKSGESQQSLWYRDAMKWWAELSAWKSNVEHAIKVELKNLKQTEAEEKKTPPPLKNEDRKEDTDKSSKGQDQKKPACGREYRLKGATSVIEITSPNFYSPNMYDDELKCTYEFYGLEGCQPSVSCSVFDIRKVNSECVEEYLEISDGLGDAVKFCGRKGPRPHEKWVSSRGQRDLYLTFVSSSKRARERAQDAQTDDHDGFLCTVQCSNYTNPKKYYSESPQIRSLPKHTEPVIEDRCHCGIKSNDRDRIVGGTTVEKHSYPWQVAIVEKGSRRPFCGASLINDRFILTASHCFPPDFDSSVEKNIEILAHAHLLDPSIMDGFNETAQQGEQGWSKASGWEKDSVSDAEEQSMRFRVKEIILHPLYRHGKFDYDVALLRIAGRIKLTEEDSPVPICLPAIGTYEDYEGEHATVVGWGLGDEKGGTTTRLLQELSVPMLPLKTCKEWMPKNNITSRMVCAGFEDGRKQDACRADSGGPLMRKVGGKFWEQIGVVSWGVGCARKKKPGFYAKVVEMNQWIHHMTSEIETKWCTRPGERSRTDK